MLSEKQEKVFEQIKKIAEELPEDDKREILHQLEIYRNSFQDSGDRFGTLVRIGEILEKNSRDFRLVIGLW